MHKAGTMARLFIAVLPPDDVSEMLRELPRKDQRGVKFVPPENWHATLRFLGDAANDADAEALDRSQVPAATAHVGPAIDMLGSDGTGGTVGTVSAPSIPGRRTAVTSRSLGSGEGPSCARSSGCCATPPSTCPKWR